MATDLGNLQANQPDYVEPGLTVPAGVTLEGLASANPLYRANVTRPMDVGIKAPNYQREATISQAMAEARQPPAAYETQQRESLLAQANPYMAPKVVLRRALPFAGVDPQSDATLRRVALLERSGHTWMDPELSFALAGSKANDQTMLGMADAIRGTLVGTWKGFKAVYDDPVLAKQPSALVSLREFLNKTLGPLPISEANTTAIQHNLQRQGFGADLAVSGVWDNGWASAWSQWRNALVNSQLSGKQAGGTTVGTAVRWLTAVLPKEATHAIVGAAIALPGLARQLAADFSGGVSAIGAVPLGATKALTGGGSFGETVQHAAARGVASVEGGSPEAQIARIQAHPVGRIIDDVSTALLLASATRAGTNIANAAGAELARGTDLAAAERGPGVIAKLLGRLNPDETGALHSRWFTNTPVLGRVGPWIDTLAGDDGYYYRARTLAARPFAYAPVRIAGDVATQAGLLGAQARGLAAIAGTANPASPLARSVQGQHFLDPIDARLRALETHVPLGPARVALGNGIDDLGFFLHPTGEGLASEAIGRDVDAATASFREAYNHIAPQWERGLQLADGKSHTMADVLNQFDTPLDGIRFVSDKTYQHTAAFYADRQIEAYNASVGPTDRLAVGLDAYRRAARRYEHEVRGDFPALQAELRTMLSLNGDELAKRVARDVTNTRLSSADWASGHGAAYMRASNVLRTEIVPQADRLLRDYSGAPLGLARLDTLTRQQAYQVLDHFEARVAQAGTSSEELAGIDDELKNFLFHHYGVDRRGADVLPTIQTKIAKARSLADDSASEVYVPADLRATLGPALERMAAEGYKPVTGTDIGWLHTEFPMLDVLDRALTPQRRTAEYLGLSPRLVEQSAVADARRLSIRRTIQQAVDDGRVVLPANHTVDTLLADLRDRDILTPQVSPLTSAVAGATVRGRRLEPYLEAARSDASIAVRERDLPGIARQRAENDIAGYLQLRDLPRAKVMAALTREIEPGLQLMDTTSAQRFYRAMVAGSANVPNYMLGISRLEDMFRASMGFAGEAIPGGLGEAVANMPNRLVQLRNELRFQLSPYFSVRRVVKTNAKLMVAGVDPTLRPLAAMGENYDRYKAVLARVVPRAASASVNAADDADRFLHAQDVFGLYNGNHYEMYAAGRWADAGKTDDQIRDLLVKTFGYGAKGVQGRSALERSANFVFFPFSFDKTLYRNLGGYLLDHPAQLVVLDRGLRAYDDWSRQHLADTGWQQWFTEHGLVDHIPVIQEAFRLNALAHGVSLGEVGGINAPFLNLFLPQSWASSTASTNTLERFVPALKDFQRIAGEAQQQVGILRSAVRANTGDFETVPILGSLRPAAVTTDAQVTAAFAALQRFQADPQIARALADNRGVANLAATNFGPSWGPAAGKRVSKANFATYLLEAKFPGFDYQRDVAGVAEAKQHEIDQWIAGLGDSAKAKQYRAFVDLGRKAVRAIGDDSATLAQASQWTQQFRDFATYYAERDPKFYSAYNRFFRRWFGPLEKVTKP